jgi:hypothetical protein
VNQLIVTVPVGVGLPVGALGSAATVTASWTVVPSVIGPVTTASALSRTVVVVSEGNCCTAELPPILVDCGPTGQLMPLPPGALHNDVHV